MCLLMVLEATEGRTEWPPSQEEALGRLCAAGIGAGRTGSTKAEGDQPVPDPGSPLSHSRGSGQLH